MKPHSQKAQAVQRLQVSLHFSLGKYASSVFRRSQNTHRWTARKWRENTDTLCKKCLHSPSASGFLRFYESTPLIFSDQLNIRLSKTGSHIHSLDSFFENSNNKKLTFIAKYNGRAASENCTYLTSYFWISVIYSPYCRYLHFFLSYGAEIFPSQLTIRRKYRKFLQVRSLSGENNFSKFSYSYI